MSKFIFLALALFLGITSAWAELKLPSVFNNQMVLQQNTEVAIWGKGNNDKEVVLKPSWSKKVYKTMPDTAGNWIVKIKTLPADHQCYQLLISQGKDRICFQDILFGEVWICSGQSNMEMKMRGYYNKPIIGGLEAIANSLNENIRLFTVDKAFTIEEQTDCKGVWQKATPASVADFSATAYFFGQQLEKSLNVPVGLIVTCWGGSSIQTWMSKESLKAFPTCKIPVVKEDMKAPTATPTGLFNGMIAPIIGYGMRGCIWYQGESNRLEPDLYRQLFKTMLADWRKRWSVGDFSFYFAQIAPYTYGKNLNSAFFREAQLLCAHENKNTAMVSLLDVGEQYDIHPSEKKTVGQRLAYAALAKTYDVKGIATDGPEYKSMKVDGNKVQVIFENAKNGLTTYGQPMNQFQVAGADRVFYPAVAQKQGQSVVVYSDKVSTPVAVRYGFTDYTQGTLYNVEGVPASSFRTDNWE